MGIFGIDPGISGAIVYLNKNDFQWWKMPLKENNEIDFMELRSTFYNFEDRKIDFHVFLERAVPFAMGSKGAFNYGRGFAAVEIALLDLDLPHTLVEPGKWTKEMHAGIAADLKPKSKSLIAAQRLFPKLVQEIPANRNGKLHDGIIDALLIAGYGSRIFGKMQGAYHYF